MNPICLARGFILILGCNLLLTATAMADPDEAAIVRAPLPSALNPLLALIIDTSGAAAMPIATRPPYDAGQDYGSVLSVDGRCERSRIYWRRGAGAAPDCQLQAGLLPFPADTNRGLQCRMARASLDTYGYYVASRAAQWHALGSGGDWFAPRTLETGAIDCRADADVAIEWDRSPLADPYIFYTGNFLNWLRAPQTAIERPIVELAATSLAQALRATDGLAVAWFRFPAAGGAGAYVAGAPTPATLAADALQALANEASISSAPLAEALAESALWLAGGLAHFGAVGEADSGAFDPSMPGHYQSPFSHACRPVTLAHLTAGQPSDDESAAEAAAALPGFSAAIGNCGGQCLSEISDWLARSDLRADLPGMQSAAVNFLSLSPVPASLAFASSAVRIDALADPLAYINLVARSLQRDAAVPAAPQLSAAAILPAASSADAADIVFGLSAPQAQQRWQGNLFRYSLRAAPSPLEPPVIVDRDGEIAIDANALPRASSRSAWSDTVDADLLGGGAAGRLPDAGTRALYAELGDPELTSGSNRLQADNPRIDRSLLGLGPDDVVTTRDVLDWLAGQRHLGDPGLHAPVIAEYPDAQRQILYAETHDGMLHAFDAASGIELWAWMPRDLLSRITELMRNEATTVRGHGIDGPLVLHRHDPDGNGFIDAAAGEHLWLLFGLGRGGNRYYALDVSDSDSPRLLWSIELPGQARLDSLAEPVVTRIAVDGKAQNSGHWVVLLAGGYDRRFDAGSPVDGGDMQALHLIDAVSGELLWTSGSSTDSDLTIAGFAASSPSAPRALDLDGDGHLDRAYSIDVTGGLWRFDFASGRAAADLAVARRLAQLGTGPQRFHATPDVSLVRPADGAQLAIAVGSGWLARPLDNSIVDRIYAVFDNDASAVSQALVEEDLHDAGDAAESMPASAPGWFRRIERHGSGEKIIGPAVTFDHALRFQTWQPLPPDTAAPCGPPQSIRRRYTLDVRTGMTHTIANETPEDDAIEIPGAGLPVALRFGFPSASSITCPGCRPRVFGMAGSEIFDPGYAGDPVRTSWRKLQPPPDSR